MTRFAFSVSPRGTICASTTLESWAFCPRRRGVEIGTFVKQLSNEREREMMNLSSKDRKGLLLFCLTDSVERAIIHWSPWLIDQLDIRRDDNPCFFSVWLFVGVSREMAEETFLVNRETGSSFRLGGFIPSREESDLPKFAASRQYAVSQLPPQVDLRQLMTPVENQLLTNSWFVRSSQPIDQSLVLF